MLNLNPMENHLKIWLDDERDPRDPKIQFNFGSSGDEIWVKTAPTAIYYLKQGCITSISLDHDLGPPNAGTGMDVANWIEEQAFHGTLPKLTWSIHSKNPVGSKNMYKAMSKADEFWNSTI